MGDIEMEFMDENEDRTCDKCGGLINDDAPELFAGVDEASGYLFCSKVCAEEWVVNCSPRG